MRNEETPCIGIVGVGLLGTAIAERVLGSGRRILGFDLCWQRMSDLEGIGGEACDGIGELLNRCGTIILSLPDSQVVSRILAENQGALRAGQTIIDTTTGCPEAMASFGNLLRSRSIAYLEATVAGSSDQVRSGEACLFLGGDATTVSASHDLLLAVAPRLFHLGPVGTASRFKLIHNMVLGLHRAVLAEGLSFASAIGFDPALVLEVLQQTPAASAVMRTKGAMMVQGDHRPVARLSQHRKDVQLILDAAERAGQEIPLTVAHLRLLQLAESMGLADADNSAVIEVYRKPVAGDV